MIKSLHITSDFDPFIGGAEIQAQRLTQALIQIGIHAAVLTKGHRSLPSREIRNGVEIYRIRVPRAPKIRRLYLTAAFFVRLLFLLPRYDIVHVHLASYHAFAAVAAARIRKKPIVIKLANCCDKFDLELLAQDFPMGWGNFMASYLAKRTTCFVATNDAMLEDLKKWDVIPSKICRISNGVSIPSKPWGDENVCQNVITTVGSLVPRKNQMILLDALKRLLQTGCKANLQFIGDGPERSRLMRRVSDQGLQKHVSFQGSIFPVEDYLRKSNIFVLPSWVEGCSNALLEAMALGMPCLASDIPGNRNLIKHKKTGMLFSPNNAEQLADILKELITYPERARALGNQAREFIIEHCSIEEVANRYKEIYSKLTNDPVMSEL